MEHDKFLVIGSNCFTGATVVSRLLELGHDVLGISRSPEPADALLPHKWRDHGRFRFCQLDLNKDIDAIADVVRRERPQRVINLAAQGMVAASWKNPDQWFTTNTVAMVRLHDRLRAFDFIKRFVQVSTPEVYGHTDQRVDETARYAPSTPYATSKLACDLSLLSFHRAYGFPVVITRSATVCGPGQQLYRIIPRTILYILTGRKVPLEGGGKATRCFMHIHDAVEGIVRCAFHGQSGEIYHFATPQLTSIRTLVESIATSLGRDFDDAVDFVNGRLGEDTAYLLDYSKAQRELKWEPLRTVEQAIQDTIAWITNNLQVLRRLPDQYIHKP